jgi:signal transduction histidine kinase
MDHSVTYRKLLYEHEVLWARYEIRDHHLRKIGEKIYDDIGQVLSLVRVQLCRTAQGPGANENATESGELVGSAIRGLRAMHRSFYPETELLQKAGLPKTLEHELELSGIGTAENRIAVQGTPRDMAAGTQLIVFRMLQEIIEAIKPGSSESISITIAYEEAVVSFLLEYSGGVPEWSPPAETEATNIKRLSLTERAALIESDLTVESKDNGRVQITLAVPFKTSLYGA